jgi:hypothetical protein
MRYLFLSVMSVSVITDSRLIHAFGRHACMFHLRIMEPTHACCARGSQFSKY